VKADDFIFVLIVRVRVSELANVSLSFVL